MTAYTLVWQPAAVTALGRIRTGDPEAAKRVRTAISALAENPLSPDTASLGGTAVRRLRLGRLRVLYEVDDINEAVHILVVGQLPA